MSTFSDKDEITLLFLVLIRYCSSCCSVLAAPTAEDHEEVKGASDGLRAKLRRMSSRVATEAASFLREISSKSSVRRRLHSFKSSFFLEEETIKLPQAVVQTYKMALAAVRTVTLGDQNQSAPDHQNDIISDDIDPGAPIFQPMQSSLPDNLVSAKQFTADAFFKELAAQRESITLQADRDRFDHYWG